FEVHPDNPQPRLIKQAAQLLHQGGVCAVPTDSSYALVCHLDDKAAADSLRRIRGVDDKHHLTLLCRDLSELASYARVDNRQFRLLKAATPGPYTFILEASKEVPRRLSHPSRKTIGLRVPEHKTLQCLLELHGAPLLATTLIPRGETEPLNDAQDIRNLLEHELAAVIDAGACHQEPSTVIDLTPMGDSGEAVVTRQGRGDVARLGL
ncbi:MAG: L-threonylcarbamoyladenylate synthase, partial [Hydrogenophaga sp.]|nr:L-threonylcarbamoyladenylate synthase [Hydrogenophaga sp.]